MPVREHLFGGSCKNTPDAQTHDSCPGQEGSNSARWSSTFEMRQIAFGVSVVIIFGYYLLGFIADALGKVGTLNPVLAAWLPPFIGLAVGGLLVMRASK